MQNNQKNPFKKLATIVLIPVFGLKLIILSVFKLMLIVIFKLLDFSKKTIQERTLVIISKNTSKTIIITKKMQYLCLAVILLAFSYLENFIDKSINSNVLISSKNKEIKNLQAMNSYFKSEFDNMNSKLEKINQYFSIVEKNKSKNVEQKNNKIINIIKKITNKEEQENLNQLTQINNQITKIENNISSRISKIEGAIQLTGLNFKKPNESNSLPNKKGQISNNQVTEISLNESNILTKNQGGPLLEGEDNKASFGNLNQKQINKFLDAEAKNFKNEIDKLIFLEKIINYIPTSIPMRNHYISSGFGTRFDPITGHTATHQGLDFVGRKNEPIFSANDGTVIFAGYFGDYGNAIDISHGLGITTRYAHLSKIVITNGQKVTKGQVIGYQGSTGRSTGDHLHYEVRYKNTPLNPRKFLEAGNFINKELTII
jgi:murein DD-endopeptidase MepM/ murein hydrolase activator NlpD